MKLESQVAEYPVEGLSTEFLLAYVRYCEAELAECSPTAETMPAPPMPPDEDWDDDEPTVRVPRAELMALLEADAAVGSRNAV